MAYTINTLTEILRNFYLEYQQCFQSDASLTSIQQKAMEQNKLKALSRQGLKYRVSKGFTSADGHPYPPRLDIESPAWRVLDEGIINDVINDSEFPLIVTIDNIASVRYFPKSFLNFSLFFSGRRTLSKSSLLKFRKGEKIIVRGKVLSCYYTFNRQNLNGEYFSFTIEK